MKTTNFVYMKTIKATTKLGKHFWTNYTLTRAENVSEAYKQPSSRKIAIDKELQALCAREGGSNYKIIRANEQCFTAAWIVKGQGLRVETKYNSYLIIID